MMSSPIGHGVTAWSSEAWRRGALDWIDERLGASGIQRLGEPGTGRVRPWSAVLELPTSVGSVWFKATAPATSFEVGLYELLARVEPDFTLKPIASDRRLGWVLLPDGGPTLGQQRGVERFGAVFPAYARFQLRFAPHAGEAIAVGVGDMRPERLPGRFAEARGLVGDASDASELAAHLEQMVPAVSEWSARLASSELPASLDHNDLHPGNVLGDPGEGVRLYDWGDAVIAHPFAAMLVPLGVVRSHLGGAALDDPALTRVRDLYLAEFAEFAAHDELVEQLELACRLAKIARALTWERALRTASEQGQEMDGLFATAVAGHLRSLLDDSYLV